jgi:hypothetical protein
VVDKTTSPLKAPSLSGGKLSTTGRLKAGFPGGGAEDVIGRTGEIRKQSPVTQTVKIECNEK